VLVRIDVRRHRADLRTGDLVLAQAASTDSSFRATFGGATYAAAAS
jgi:hypothetical protein